jgi:hypothetical protein
MLAGFGPAVAAGFDARIRCQPAGEGVVSVLVDGPRIAFRAEPGDVMTLTDYGADSGMVRLADRAGPPELVRFPGPIPL